MLVPPEDPEMVEHAIRLTMTGDRLLDEISEANYLLGSGKAGP